MRISQSESIISAGLVETYQRDLADSILQTHDPEEIALLVHEAVTAHLDWHNPVCFSIEISVGATFGMQNSDGRKCLVKINGPDCIKSELASRAKFQQWIFQKDYPCPSLLLHPKYIQGRLTLIEAYLDQGRRANGHVPADRKLMAEALATLVELGQHYPDSESIPTDTLCSVPDSPWPKPHNILFNFESTQSGAEWIDEIGSYYGVARDRVVAPRVLGHVDWGAKHTRISGGKISAIYDWDSTARVHETCVVGSAAVNYTATWYVECPNRPTMLEMVAFVTDYEAARGKLFDDQEVEEITANSYYSAAYGARCEHAADDLQDGSRDEFRRFLRGLIKADFSTLLKQRYR